MTNITLIPFDSIHNDDNWKKTVQNLENYNLVQNCQNMWGGKCIIYLIIIQFFPAALLFIFVYIILLKFVYKFHVAKILDQVC